MLNTVLSVEQNMGQTSDIRLRISPYIFVIVDKWHAYVFNTQSLPLVFLSWTLIFVHIPIPVQTRTCDLLYLLEGL